MQYLYADGEFWHFMVPDTFEQYTAGKEALGDGAIWLKDGMNCTVMLWNGVPLNVTPPAHVELKIIETDPGLRGDTATGGGKPAKLETGAVVRVPLFINEGEFIRVDTRTGEYIARAKAPRLTSALASVAASRVVDERFEPAPIFFIEARELRAVDIQHAEQFAARESSGRRFPSSKPQSHAMWPGNSCTFGTTSVQRSRCRRSADALAKRDPHAGGPTLKRTDDEFAVLQQIESCPVHVRQRVEEQRRAFARFAMKSRSSATSAGQLAVQLRVERRLRQVT